ncbi:C3a anaphylatoxin chemotactic receptor [Engraulis encrasicolus]|uniref:C3a anaphylatoxin chemotactic receptor n=1 Tax=Engraulis encrasicolus TaxID=184585 RepID=UPI002FD42234
MGNIYYYDYTNMSSNSTDNYMTPAEGEYYDYANMTSEEEEATAAATAVKIISITIYSLTFLLGVPGNAFVLWIAGLKMKRTVNVAWFINLAAADFLCCLSIPFSISDTVLDSRWPYGTAMCKVITPFVILSMFASVFTLALIGLDRLALVVTPVWAQNHRSLGLAWGLCGLAWFLALMLSLPAMVLKAAVTHPYTNVTHCTYAIHEDDELSKAIVGRMQMARFLLGFVVPLLVIVSCYTLITLRVRSSSFRAKRAFKIIVAVVVAFFVCWLPYHALGLAREYGQEDEDGEVVFLLDQLSIALAYVNSCLNPLLYVFMGQDFKEKVRLSLRRILENAFSEDATHSTSTTRSKVTQSRITSSSAQV